MVNLTDVAETFGNFFGVNEQIGGIIISVLILLAFLLALSIYSRNEMAIAVSGVALISLFTFLEWFPIWITIIIVLIVALLLGKRATSTTGATGGEM